MTPQRRADLQFVLGLLAAVALLVAFILSIHAAS
jgi:hypothetical protein